MIVLGGAWMLLGLSVTDPFLGKTATIGGILKPCEEGDAALGGLALVMQQTKNPVAQGQSNPKTPASGTSPRPAPLQPTNKPATGAPASTGNRAPTSTPAAQGTRQTSPPTSQPKTIEPSGSRQPANSSNSRSDSNKTGQPAQTGRLNTPPATGSNKPIPKEEPKQVGRPKDMGAVTGSAAGKPIPKEEPKQVGRPKDMGAVTGSAAGKPIPKEEPKQVGRPPKDMGAGTGTAAGKPPVKVESLSSSSGSGNKTARENMTNNGKPVPLGNGAVAGRPKPGTPAQAKVTAEKARVEANQKIDALPARQKVEAQKALEETRRKNEAAHKVPAPGSNASVSKQPVKPLVSDKNGTQPLGQVKVDKSLAEKFNNKDPKKTLSSADYLGLVGKSNGIVFPESTNRRIIDLAKDPKATSAEIEAYNKSLNGTPLSDSEVEILKNRLH